jgi:lysozyme
MRTGEKGINLIKSFEGLYLKAYLCPAKILTIGYGHTRNVKANQAITEAQAVELLREDLRDAENTVNAQKLNINQHQFDALVSFVFNCGSGNFLKSSLLRMIKVNPMSDNIRIEFQKWNKGGGKVLLGLTRRRKSESELYFLPL